MIAIQVPVAAPDVIWPRTAIHDTVANIVKQVAYRRDLRTTLLDRIMQWIADMFSRLVEAVGGLPHGKFVATVAFGVILVLVAARLLYSARMRRGASDEASLHRGRATSAGNPWREAERLAASGQFTDAAHALYRAALAMLAAEGLVRLHESKTSGDYARDLRRRGSPVYAPFRRFGARYDRIIYGTGSCDAAEYAILLDAARALTVTRSERAA